MTNLQVGCSGYVVDRRLFLALAVFFLAVLLAAALVLFAKLRSPQSARTRRAGSPGAESR